MEKKLILKKKLSDLLRMRMGLPLEGSLAYEDQRLKEKTENTEESKKDELSKDNEPKKKLVSKRIHNGIAPSGDIDARIPPFNRGGKV